MNHKTFRVLVLAALIATACRGRDAARDARPADTARAPSSPSAPETSESARMAELATSELKALEGASADSLRRALPSHRQLVANMISEMNREMRDMNMRADAPWTATVDSLRQDLTRMPDLGNGELAVMMPAHLARVERLIESHRTMMRGMR